MIQLRIKEEAQSQNMSQKDLAEKSGVTAQLLNRYWHNNMQRVELEQLEKIANALSIKPGDLIVDKDKQENEKLTKEEAINGIKQKITKLVELDQQTDHVEDGLKNMLKEIEDAQVNPPLLTSKFDAYIRLVASGNRRSARILINNYVQHYEQLDALLAQLEA